MARSWLYGLLVAPTLVYALPGASVARDAGLQPICRPISSALTSAADFAAKKHEWMCPPDQVRAEPTSSRRSLLARDDQYSCSEEKPCKDGACCAKSGYCGFGEKYCGKGGDSPNDKCWSNCDAHAECGRYADPPDKTCPLNVCCSQHGFCGMTEEFCEVTDDEKTSCQSNCEQPDSGSSNGDVQKRIIGYYEAWNDGKSCIPMKMRDILVASLTHIYYSFAYIKPDTYDIVPMETEDGDTLSTDSFAEFTDLKRQNPKVKAIVALGGWTFNDNHTIWQPVFSDLASSDEKRVQFAFKVNEFLMRYGFDGVDIDWEYPGAGDRGGNPEDGENFTKVLENLRVVLGLAGSATGKQYEISFTAPSSYWYLRHFDLKASERAVDYINLMSYDLHGVWDRDNPIGSQVLAHTNLTEINQALNLLWRNDIDPGKVNLGLGFYGRSFQLADPSCHTPGCLFKGGAAPGPCTDNSGTLSYKEIMDIMYDLEMKPEYDEDNAVKWITWNGDQWVSFDDEETFQRKIEFANNLGLGGVLIWAIDLDNEQLDALAAVLHPKKLGSIGGAMNKSATWEDIGGDTCYATPCGESGRCDTGYIAVETTVCAAPISSFPGGGPGLPMPEEKQRTTLCCPFGAVPAPGSCHWRGGDPYCNGQCLPGEVAIQMSKFGDGAQCSDGHKFLCCETQRQQPDCRWTACGDSCSSDENEIVLLTPPKEMIRMNIRCSRRR